MDILDRFNESKEAIVEIEKALFDVFETNDPYGIIRNSDLTYLDFTDHKQDKSKLVINLYSYKDVVPRISFDCNRASTLSCKDGVIETWVAKCQEIVLTANILKCKRFLKAFDPIDHDLIARLIVTHSKCKNSYSDAKIAEFAAKEYTKQLI